MKLYEIQPDGEGLERLRRAERPDPKPGPGQVLVRVRAASLNYRDQIMVRGAYRTGPITRPVVPLSDGAGEAVNAPATYSLLADSFPREKLPRAMAVLNVGFVAGTAISLIIGGVVIAALAKVHVVLPVIGAVHTWQLVFFAVGLQ